ncbi:MAG: hypothetical protein FWC22_01825 [Treponema sp.]|nr:hypothetical protein [Treponema sp.]
MKKIIIALLVLSMCGLFIGYSISSNNNENSEKDNIRIYIKNNQFMAGDKRIWINGVNTPWNKWDEMGSLNNWNAYDNRWWDNEFARLKKAGVNATRIWISCKNDEKYNPPIAITANGQITGIREKFWTDLDQLFALALKHKIYIMATLTSFDHFVEQAPWQNMIKSQTNVQSFAERYTLPFVNRYKDNPYLWSIDLCNEIDWLVEKNDVGRPNPTWAQIQYFIAYNAAVIHENSDILVTVGFFASKYNGADSQRASDGVLRQQYNNPNAKLDFWSPHYYAWVGEWYGVPFYLTPSGNLSGSKPGGPFSGGWQLDASKPAILGECSAAGTGGNERNYVASNLRPPNANSIITDYEYAYNNGWQGVMAWTSNGVDGNGNLSNIEPATKYMMNKYGEIIFPNE